jgi:hypothetical protein
MQLNMRMHAQREPDVAVALLMMFEIACLCLAVICSFGDLFYSALDSAG